MRMARLRRETPAPDSSSSDNSQAGRVKNRAYDLASLANGHVQTSQTKPRTSPRKRQTQPSYLETQTLSDDDGKVGFKLQPKTTPARNTARRQIRLAPLSSVSASQRPLYELSPTKDARTQQRSPKVRPSAKAGAVRLPETDSKLEKAADLDDRSGDIEIEESLWCGSNSDQSSSEDELPSLRKILHAPRIPSVDPSIPKTKPSSSELDLDVSTRLENLSLRGEWSDLSSKTGKNRSSRPESSSDKENFGAFLRFSPPRLHSPNKFRSPERMVTPPASPNKSRLQSPSKTRTRVPTPPHRQSLDAFWNADAVNDWTDQFSPQKALKSPKKLKFIKDDPSTSPTSSPRKLQSPLKRLKAENEGRKVFEASKHIQAERILLELDQVVTQGKIKELAASTGGVRIVWSKTLNSTAGRANWRRQTTKSKLLDGTIETTHQHHASIELAEKVIDDENRLLNVIAHEFCHLANFMISGIKDQPHGSQFKAWGRKCTQAFQDRGVEVTTKHSYQIDYKYIWQCSNEECAVEFKRHSKSIDPKKHTCGTCRSRLVQIKPVPRKDNGGSGYAAYVKAHFADIKRTMPGAAHKQIMEAIGKRYREEKAVDVPETRASDETDKVARVLEFITLDDD